MSHVVISPPPTMRLMLGMGVGIALHVALWFGLQSTQQWVHMEHAVRSAPTQLSVSFVIPPQDEPVAEPVQEVAPPLPVEAPQPDKPKLMPKPVPMQKQEPVKQKKIVQEPVEVTKTAFTPPPPATLPVVQDVQLRSERVPPSYPKRALRRGIEGVVIIHAEIDAKGRQRNISVKRSSGHNSLDRAAIEAVRQWSFLPTIIAGTAVASLVEVPIQFSIR